jgi:hypothetical protein
MTDDDDDIDEGAPPPIEPEPGEAASPKRIRRKKLTAEILDRESTRFWRGVMADPIGRREIWNLLRVASCFEERHAAGPTGFPDPEATSYYRGQRDFALNWYFRLQQLARESVFVMHDEHDPRFAKPEKGAK